MKSFLTCICSFDDSIDILDEIIDCLYDTFEQNKKLDKLKEFPDFIHFIDAYKEYKQINKIKTEKQRRTEKYKIFKSAFKKLDDSIYSLVDDERDVLFSLAISNILDRLGRFICILN